MPITNPAVLDQLPGTAIVYVSVFTTVTAFHVWRDCRSLKWKTVERTIAQARADGLGLCSYCAKRAHHAAMVKARIAT